MKKLALMLLGLILLLGCQEQESSQLRKDIQLVSETGFKIANSAMELKEKIKPHLAENEQLTSDFVIEKVTFINYGGNDFALIDFRYADGTKSNILITNSAMSAEKLSNGRLNCSSCNCYSVKCTGTCGCQVSFTPPEIEGGQPTFKCTCTDCTMSVRQYEC